MLFGSCRLSCQGAKTHSGEPGVSWHSSQTGRLRLQDPSFYYKLCVFTCTYEYIRYNQTSPKNSVLIRKIL